MYFAHQLEHQRVGATIAETDMKVLSTALDFYIKRQIVNNAEENKANPYKCLICSKQYKTLEIIQEHVRERHVYRSLPQPIQPKLHTLRKQLLIHSDVKLYSCRSCGRKFRNRSDKTTHERMHTEVSIFNVLTFGFFNTI